LTNRQGRRFDAAVVIACSSSDWEGKLGCRSANDLMSFQRRTDEPPLRYRP